MEPAEYYGLMIEPLVLAYQLTRDPVWASQARALALHVSRSAWQDDAGALRFHRLYARVPPAGRYRRVREPMLVAGMGLTLEAVRKVSVLARDEALATFVAECHATQALYQHPAGFFLSASGWGDEADVVPSTAWHSHDAWHLLNAYGVAMPSVRPAPAAPRAPAPLALLLGTSCFYGESGQNWMVGDYAHRDAYKLLGRKDRAFFGRDMGWTGGPRQLPADFSFPQIPTILLADDRLVYMGLPPPGGLMLINAAGLPLQFTAAGRAPRIHRM